MAKNRSAQLPHATVRKIMKNSGGLIVSKDAVEFIKKRAEEMIAKETSDAKKIVANAKREKITRKDLELASKF